MLTVKYKKGYIHYGNRGIRVQVINRDFSKWIIKTVKSTHAAKCVITRESK